jgi:hypothetical protein
MIGMNIDACKICVGNDRMVFSQPNRTKFGCRLSIAVRCYLSHSVVHVSFAIQTSTPNQIDRSASDLINSYTDRIVPSFFLGKHNDFAWIVRRIRRMKKKRI